MILRKEFGERANKKLDKEFPKRGDMRIIMQVGKSKYENQISKKVFKALPKKQLADIIHEMYDELVKRESRPVAIAMIHKDKEQ